MAPSALQRLLVEMGLASRPWSLWIGPRTPQNLLSPYLRDLGPRLLPWARAHPQRLPRTLVLALGRALAARAHLPPADAPAWLDALVEAFVASDARLAPERAAAELQVGMFAVPGDARHVAIDLGRLVPDLVDARLTLPAAPGSQAPVLVRLAWDPTRADGGGTPDEAELAELAAAALAAMQAPPRLVTLGPPMGATSGSEPRTGPLARALGHVGPNPPEVPRWLAPERAWPHRRHDSAALAHVRALCGVPPG